MSDIDPDEIVIVMNRYQTKAGRFVGSLLAMKSRTKKVRVGGVWMRPIHLLIIEIL